MFSWKSILTIFLAFTDEVVFVHFQARSTFHFPDHTTVVITITDINDNQPVFSNQTYWFAIAENSDIGAIVGQVKATDTDQVSYRSRILISFFPFFYLVT